MRDALHQRLLRRLEDAAAIDWSRAVVDSAQVRAAKRGAHTGPNPTDRGKPGLKRTVVADGQGLYLGIHAGPANRRDEKALVPALEAMPVAVGPGGAPRCPRRLRGDAGYGWAWPIALAVATLVTPVLALRGRKQHGSGLGRTRRVVERSLSWPNNYRRPRACDERTEAHAQALHTLPVCHRLAKRVARLSHRL